MVHPASRCTQGWLLHVSDTLTSMDHKQTVRWAPTLEWPLQPLTALQSHFLNKTAVLALSAVLWCRTDQAAAAEAEGRQLRFLANVDPVDVARALNGLKPETTMVIVVSKTFTTAETMLNARTVR